MSQAASTPMVPAGLGDYFTATERPLNSLLFVLPLIIAYEVGAAWYAADSLNHTETHILCFTWLRRFFLAFGASGHFLPACSVIAILLACHVARNDPWRPQPGSILGMYAESALLGVPPLVIAQLLARIMPGQAAGVTSYELSWKGDAVLAIGAGIYEELIFRLALFSLLSIILVDWMKGVRLRAGVVIVIVSAVLFSAHHHLVEPFAWRPFVFRILAGAYFGTVYLVRGFGVSVGTHAAYDIICSTAKRMVPGI